MSKITMSQVATSNFTYRRYTFDYFLKSAQKLGVENIELSGCHPHFSVYEALQFDVKSLAKQIKEHHLTVSAIEPEQNFLPINIAARDQYFREQSVKQLGFYIENAHEFNCSKVIIYPGKTLINHPRSEAWKYSRDSIHQLSKLAKKNDVTILLESVSGFVSDLMTDSKTVKRMIDEIGADNIGCCVNSSAAFAAGETLEDYFRLFGSKIGMVQLSDSTADNEQLVWGDGEQNLDVHINTLREYGYAGAVALELFMEELADGAEENYAACIEYFKKHID